VFTLELSYPVPKSDPCFIGSKASVRSRPKHKKVEYEYSSKKELPSQRTRIREADHAPLINEINNAAYFSLAIDRGGGGSPNNVGIAAIDVQFLPDF
jgi:hypothetical protein